MSSYAISYRIQYLVKSYWLESKANGLADTLSCFNEKVITNLYLYLQNTLALILNLSPKCNLFKVHT